MIMNGNMIIDEERRHAAEYCVVNNCAQSQEVILQHNILGEIKKYRIDFPKKSQKLVGQILDFLQK